MINGAISHWMTREKTATRPALEGHIDADICIIGAGFTGLWSAFHLTNLRPGARIIVLEKEQVGYGASGRNAGWLSPLVPGNRKAFARTAGNRQAAVRLQERMLEAVDEVLDTIRSEGLDAQARRSGNVVVARTPAAMQRLRARRLSDLQWGYPENEVQELDAAAVAARVNVAQAQGGLYYPTVGRLNPGRLVLELARLCEDRGVEILEHSPVTEITAGRATTAAGGEVRAPVVLRCTEGYSSALGKERRRIIPINSSIVVTQPLPEQAWNEIGWNGYECLSDAAHVFSYLQKTDDRRILIGGRGNPYRFASGTGGIGETDPDTVQALVHRLHSLFPQTADVPIAHAWSGVLGVTRDWCASVAYDPVNGLGHANGYAGHGVTSAYLAAKSLAELSAGRKEEDAVLPWVGHRTRNWEPEPIRWLGVHGMYRLFALADRWEEKTNAAKTSWLARAGSHLAGLND